MAEGKNIFGVCLSVITSLSYCYFISSRIPKGKYRFISLLPIFFHFTILPLYLTFTINQFITTFFITWLGNFKLLLLCFDQGPLSWGPPNSLLQFITIAALPIKIKQNKNHPDYSISTKPKKIPLNLATEALLLALLVTILHSGREGNYIHPKVVLVLYCCLLYLLANILVASSGKLVRAVMQIELEPPSDEPYLSTSLQDFWGRRWNLMITNSLRHTVYLPIKSASMDLLGKDKASLVAVFASFVVSAFMHEFLLCYLIRAPPTWEMTSFFLLHGVCVVVELVAKRKLADCWPLPSYVSIPLTVGFVVSTSFWLFFPPMMKNGLDVKVIDEFMLFLEYIKNKLHFMYLTAQRWN